MPSSEFAGGQLTHDSKVMPKILKDVGLILIVIWGANQIPFLDKLIND